MTIIKKSILEAIMKKIILGLALCYVFLIIQIGFINYDNELMSKTHEINHVTNQLVEANNKLALIQNNYTDLLEIVKVSRSMRLVEPAYQNDVPTITPRPTLIPKPTAVPTAIPTPKPTPKPVTSGYTESDLIWLSRIITKEAGGESKDHQRACGQVVLNRSNKYNMTIKETVFEYNVLRSGKKSYVFSPAAYSSFKTSEPFKECIEIAKELLSGKVYKPVGKALFFCTSNIYKPGGFHYDYSIGNKTHTITETLRLKNNNGTYTIFFRLL